jgi:hypothetical protein
MNTESIKERVQKIVKELLINHAGNFVNDFDFGSADDPSEAIEKFNVTYGKYMAMFDKAILDGAVKGINKACNETFYHCVSRAVDGGEIDQARADVLENEWNGYDEQNLYGLVRDLEATIQEDE